MRVWPLVLLAAWSCTLPAAAADLDTGTVIVTGMDQRDRPGGLRRALRQVLVKVSGNPAWLDDPRADGMDPEALVDNLVYLDRQSRLPKHDEQGTRDRPYDLIVRFDPGAIDTVLQAAGERRWMDRPVVAVRVVIKPRLGPPIMMAPDTDADEPHRGALLDSAGLFGMTVRIAPPGAEPNGATPLLEGVVDWQPEGGWRATWSMSRQGSVHTWSIAGVGFDAAYRRGLAGAAAILSGHGGWAH